MKCLRCCKRTYQGCITCGSPYCSQLCQQNDEHNHKVVCYPLLHQRIKSCCDFAINHSGDATWILSEAYGWPGEDIRITPFGTMDGYHCAVCANTVQPRPNHRVLYQKYKEKVYYMCDNCTKAKKKLCPVTLAETKLCFKYNIYPIFLACLKRCGIRMPKNIKQMIYQAVDSCHHLKK